jgi:hypothetical protein
VLIVAVLETSHVRRDFTQRGRFPDVEQIPICGEWFDVRRQCLAGFEKLQIQLGINDDVVCTSTAVNLEKRTLDNIAYAHSYWVTQ